MPPTAQLFRRLPRRDDPDDRPRWSPILPLGTSATPAAGRSRGLARRTTSAHSRGSDTSSGDFAPPQTNRPTEGGQVHQHGRPIPLRPHPPATCFTGRAGLAGTDHQLQRCPLTRLVDPDQLHVAQAYQLLAHARRDQSPPGVLLPRMSFLNSRLWRTPPNFWWIPNPTPRSPTPPSFPKSLFMVGACGGETPTDVSFEGDSRNPLPMDSVKIWAAEI